MLEVCVDTTTAAVAARAAGAGRIELCSALDVGGVTPCQSLIQSVRRLIDCPLMVLIRPRTGDFLYDHYEQAQSLESIRIALGCGADGVVVGGTNEAAQLDLPYLSALRKAAVRFELVMHRAFDFVAEPKQSIDQIIELGFDRVLTSGGPSGNVMNHRDELRRLIEHAQDRITIMPGGGVSAANAAALIQACGCQQLHGSFRLPSTQLGSGGLGEHRPIDSESIKQVSSLLEC